MSIRPVIIVLVAMCSGLAGSAIIAQADSPTTTSAVDNQIRQLYDHDKYQEAINAANAAFAANPKDEIAVRVRGACYYLLGDYKGMPPLY